MSSKTFILKENNLQIETELGTIDIEHIEDGEVISVEIFPPNQSKESFESAEYRNFYNIESVCNDTDFLYLIHLPMSWTRTQRNDILDKVICGMLSLIGTIENLEDFKGTDLYESLRVVRNMYNDDYCKYCGCKLTDENRRQDEYEITVCEDCFIEHVANKKGLNK